MSQQPKHWDAPPWCKPLYSQRVPERHLPLWTNVQREDIIQCVRMCVRTA